MSPGVGSSEGGGFFLRSPGHHPSPWIDVKLARPRAAGPLGAAS